ncbi:electron transfer flavoprotein subunit beta/FixA family protein [Terriglobus albidus]|uniref:electron transfer flavoprotein subunit beta/FixA family protein n=1 Tax=Terriglobus albidus TaxID=1592106 RepID=UPI0021DF7B63|nr:electron transfer flavoprotein subunit beta/FixA family protein [Terriglobus albidus]
MGLRILSVIRQVLDAEESVRIKDGMVDPSSSKLVLDTMDEYGLEEALRIRDAQPETEVVALAVGPARCEEALRTALAIGADRAILVETFEPLDVITVGNVAAQVARKEQSDLIFCGGQEADWDSQAFGAAIAEYLNWPQLTWTTALNLEGRTLTGTHDIDEGTESFSVELPAVITTQQGLCEPRYPTLPNIMKARKKELRRESFESFGLHSRLKFIRSEIQVKERMRRIVDGKDGSAAAQQLVEFLRNETRVIG